MPGYETKTPFMEGIARDTMRACEKSKLYCWLGHYMLDEGLVTDEKMGMFLDSLPVVKATPEEQLNLLLWAAQTAKRNKSSYWEREFNKRALVVISGVY